MLSNKNRIYGLVIGGAIADSMGAVAAYAPDLQVNDPFSSHIVNIKPGYWTEPTGLFLTRLQSIINESEPEPANQSHMSSTGRVARYDYQLLPFVVQSSVLCLMNPDLDIQLATSEQLWNTGSLINNDTIKLWISIIDGVLHGLSKKTLFNPSLYTNLDLVPETQFILQGIGSVPNPELELVQEVLGVFHSTNNFIDGLKVIVNNSMAPAWTGALYGQLAGAYYGITDIPESWMDVVQHSDDFLSSLERIPDVHLQGVRTNLIVSTEEKHIASKPCGYIAPV